MAMLGQTEKAVDDGKSEELCIRFVNTAAWRLRDPSEERLPDAGTLIGWLAANSLGSRQYWMKVRAHFRNDRQAAADFHDAALQLREAIYGIFRARIQEVAPSPDALALLNNWMERPSPGARLGMSKDEAGWLEASPTAEPLDLLKPIAVSAAGLIMGPRLRKVRQCADDRGCGWLFVDESRAQNRRWCSMGDCGNRAKAMRHREAKRAKHAS
jgi:predicted RNA-binding Zn ribbon-like protein